eukprot:1638676-Prymnesium_polylepis.1
MCFWVAQSRHMDTPSSPPRQNTQNMSQPAAQSRLPGRGAAHRHSREHASERHRFGDKRRHGGSGDVSAPYVLSLIHISEPTRRS